MTIKFVVDIEEVELNVICEQASGSGRYVAGITAPPIDMCTAAVCDKAGNRAEVIWYMYSSS